MTGNHLGGVIYNVLVTSYPIASVRNSGHLQLAEPHLGSLKGIVSVTKLLIPRLAPLAIAGWFTMRICQTFTNQILQHVHYEKPVVRSR